MNRRAFIKALGTALATAGLIKDLGVVEAMVPETITSTPLPLPSLGEHLFRIVFPDGTHYSFKGIITAKATHIPADDLVTMDLSVRPVGAAEFGTVRMSGVHTARAAELQVVEPDGHTKMHDLLNVELDPGGEEKIDISTFGDPDRYIVGLRRKPDVSFTMAWTPEGEEQLNKILHKQIKETL